MVGQGASSMMLDGVTWENAIQVGGGFAGIGGARAGSSARCTMPTDRVPKVTRNRANIHIQLRNGGFNYHGTTKGGYVQYRSPDGSRVWIRPNGEVIRFGPKVTPSGGGKRYNPRIDTNGNRIDTHNPGEFVDPISRHRGGGS